MSAMGSYFARAEVRSSCTSPECGCDAQTAHFLAKRGYIQRSHVGPREVYIERWVWLATRFSTRGSRVRTGECES